MTTNKFTSSFFAQVFVEQRMWEEREELGNIENF